MKHVNKITYTDIYIIESPHCVFLSVPCIIQQHLENITHIDTSKCIHISDVFNYIPDVFYSCKQFPDIAVLPYMERK